MDIPIIGVVKWYDKLKGFGFLKLPGGGMDVFVHANQLRKSGLHRDLVEGEHIQFLIEKGPKGSFAINITPVALEPKHG